MINCQTLLPRGPQYFDITHIYLHQAYFFFTYIKPNSLVSRAYQKIQYPQQLELLAFFFVMFFSRAYILCNFVLSESVITSLKKK